jgi:hypothetical protein
VEDLLRHFILNNHTEVRPIVTSNHTYQDLLVMFGMEFVMPPAEAMRGDVVEYRCPYIAKCPAEANCFAAAAPEPLQDGDILNIKCRLCGNQKIPIYARDAAQFVNKR